MYVTLPEHSSRDNTEEGVGRVNIRKHFLAVRSVRWWKDLPGEMEEVLLLESITG